MSDSYTVYKHTSPNSKTYIGITCQNVNHRWCRGANYRNNPNFYSDIMKYGWDNIKHEIIAEGLTQSEAFDLEIKLIAEYNSTDPTRGYNRNKGGGGNSAAHKGMHHADETKRLIGERIKNAHSANTYESAKKKVLCVEDGVVYESITKAAEAHHVSVAYISLLCRNIRHNDSLTFEFA